MDPSDVGRIEKGQMTPYPAQAQKLAAVFGISVDELHRVLGFGAEAEQ
jgi:ribosome-binding protein aMBF1 (putative translation factor)